MPERKILIRITWIIGLCVVIAAVAFRWPTIEQDMVLIADQRADDDRLLVE